MKAEKLAEIKLFPPYVPFKAFKAFIERLNGTAIPPAIDPSLLRNMSGSARSQLMSCLRFLNLIGPNGTVTDKFRELIKSYKTEVWQESIKNVIFEAYHTVIGDVDLDTGTDAQLVTAFRQRGNVDGQVLDKSKRFFLSAMNESGVTYSPHFGTRKPAMKRAGGTKKAAKKGSETPVWEEEENNEIETGSKKMRPFRIPIPSKGEAIIVFPADADISDWTRVRKMLDAFFGHDDE